MVCFEIFNIQYPKANAFDFDWTAEDTHESSGESQNIKVCCSLSHPKDSEKSGNTFFLWLPGATFFSLSPKPL
jgi:hypothetical protein